MSDMKSAKRRAVGALISGGLSAAVLLGLTGTANAAGSVAVYGFGSTPNASQRNALDNAMDACGGFGSYSVLRDPAAYWNGYEYQTNMVVECR